MTRLPPHSSSQVPAPTSVAMSGSCRSRHGSIDNHDAPGCSKALMSSPSAFGGGHRRAQSHTGVSDSNSGLLWDNLAATSPKNRSMSRSLHPVLSLPGHDNEQDNCCGAHHVCNPTDHEHCLTACRPRATLATYWDGVYKRIMSSSWTVPILVIATVASVFVGLFGLLYLTAPSIPEDVKLDLKLPRSVEQLKSLAAAALHISRTHFPTVAGTYLVAYTFLQTFCVPGSLFLTVLGGALFPLPLALALVATCSAVGASISFLLSEAIGKPLVEMYLAARLASWSQQVATQRHQLFNYIVFLRVAPLIPNWFINLSSPHLQVPLGTFFLATFFGVLPPSFVYARLGSSIQHLTSKDFSFWNPLNLIAIVVFCTLAAVPILVQRYRERDGEDEAYAPLTSQGDEEEGVLSESADTVIDMSHMLGESAGQECGSDLRVMGSIADDAVEVGGR